jgi:hypothetical protein
VDLRAGARVEARPYFGIGRPPSVSLRLGSVYRPTSGGVCTMDSKRQITTKTPSPAATNMIVYSRYGFC